MKKLQNLKGAKALNKKEQQSINGGWDAGSPDDCAINGCDGCVGICYQCQENGAYNGMEWCRRSVQ